MDKLNPFLKPKISVEINDGTPEIAVEGTKAIETGTYYLIHFGSKKLLFVLNKRTLIKQ